MLSEDFSYVFEFCFTNVTLEHLANLHNRTFRTVTALLTTRCMFSSTSNDFDQVIDSSYFFFYNNC